MSPPLSCCTNSADLSSPPLRPSRLRTGIHYRFACAAHPDASTLHPTAWRSSTRPGTQFVGTTNDELAGGLFCVSIWGPLIFDETTLCHVEDLADGQTKTQESPNSVSSPVPPPHFEICAAWPLLRPMMLTNSPSSQRRKKLSARVKGEASLDRSPPPAASSSHPESLCHVVRARTPPASPNLRRAPAAPVPRCFDVQPHSARRPNGARQCPKLN